MDEILDIVDERGCPTGRQVSRSEAHRSGILHRTSHLWLLRRRDDGVELLLQRRSLNKESWPGCYDISSAGHIPAGCGFEESALRELREELGLDATADELIWCGDRRFVFQYSRHGMEFTDNQISRVFALWRDVGREQITVQAEEVEDMMWIGYDECRRRVEQNLFDHCIAVEELDMLRRVICERQRL